MSQETTKKRVLRKATFTVNKDKGTKIFVPVNKRAKKWAKFVGKRTKLTTADLKAIKATGKVEVFAYTETGSLKAIKV